VKQVTLPNGLTVFENNASETATLYSEIFVDGLYERHGITIGGDACIFDVGANIGMSAIYFHRRAANVRVYAFEPAPATFAVLEANMKLHRVAATLFNVAVSSAPGEASFTFYPKVTGMSGLYADPVEERALAKQFLVNSGIDPEDAEFIVAEKFVEQKSTVELRTVAQVVAAEHVERIDLLKVDVEKAESDVFAGLGDHWDKVRQLVAEVHDIDGRLDAMTAILHARGFEVARDQDPTLAGTNVFTVYGTRR